MVANNGAEARGRRGGGLTGGSGRHGTVFKGGPGHTKSISSTRSTVSVMEHILPQSIFLPSCFCSVPLHVLVSRCDIFVGTVV